VPYKKQSDNWTCFKNDMGEGSECLGEEVFEIFLLNVKLSRSEDAVGSCIEGGLGGRAGKSGIRQLLMRRFFKLQLNTWRHGGFSTNCELGYAIFM